MAQYYAVLKKAIGALQPSSSDARRGIYEKARSALVGQLKAIQPPLSTSEISRQRLELEEAIRKVEREALAGVPMQVVQPAAPPVSYEVEEAEPPADEPVIEDAEPVEPAYAADERDDFAVEARPYEPDLVDDEVSDPPPVVPLPRNEPPAAALRQAFGFDEPRAGEARPSPMSREARSVPASREARREATPSASGWRPLTVAADPEPEAEETPATADPVIEPAREEKGRRRRSVLEDPEEAEVGGQRRRSRLPALILTTIMVLAIGLIGYLWQQGLLTDATAAISALFSRDGSAAGEVAALDPNKVEDRIVPEGSLAPAPNVRVINTTPGAVAAPPQPPAAAPPTTIGEIAALAPAAPPATAPPPSGPLVAQQAMLIEQGATEDAAPIVTPGTVIWSFQDGGTDGATVVADVTVPSNSVRLRLFIHENNDAAVPASHLIELSAEGVANLPGGGLQQVLVPVMKDTLDAVGQQLIGGFAKVTETLHWIALSSDETNRATNLRLLGEQKWMDLPLIYANGRRAFLTLELGPAGEGLLDEAIVAWAQ